MGAEQKITETQTPPRERAVQGSERENVPTPAPVLKVTNGSLMCKQSEHKTWVIM